MTKLDTNHRLLSEQTLEELAAIARDQADWEERLSAARQWTATYQKSDVENTKEKALQSVFLTRVFGSILGYRDRGEGRVLWTLEFEPTTDIDAKRPDGSVGFYQKGENTTLGVVELKDALTDLDAKQLTRTDRLSPVEQAFLYVVKYERAKYVFISNFRTLRLYSKAIGMSRYEEFNLKELQSQESVARLVGVCSARVVIGTEPGRASPLDKTLSATEFRPQQEITESFYQQYAAYRDRVVRWVADKNPQWGANTVHIVQKYLDRILFILFAEDVGLLPSNILERTIEHGLRSRARRPDRAWQELVYLFNDIDKGRPDIQPEITRYNGGLFAQDDLLEQLSLPDQLVEDLRYLQSYDFRTEIDVNILGHVFENSLVEIEILRREISLDPHSVEKTISAVDAHRKSLGIYYTPAWVTHFIIDQTLGRHLQAHRPAERLLATIFDPSCGSGAFLSEALSYLTNYSRSLASAAIQKGKTTLFDSEVGVTASTHLSQIFGIDILPEAVEISKLSLWLKSAARSRPLSEIDTIMTGNTLSDDAQHGTLESKTFNVIVGNPPWGAVIDYELDPSLTLDEGQYDSYELFVEKSLREFCAPDGYFGFVIPDRILRPEGEKLRRFLFNNYTVLTVLKLGEGVFPGVFRAAVVLIAQNSKPSEQGAYDGLIITKDDREKLEGSGSAQLVNLMNQRGGSIRYSRVRQDPHYNIVLASDHDVEITKTMKEGSAPWLGEDGIFGTYGRGEELGRDTFLVQCPGCFEWSINPRKRAKRRGGGFELKICPDCETSFSIDEALAKTKILVGEYGDDDVKTARLFAGEQINRYFTTAPAYLRLAVAGFNYKPKELYTPPKLLIRQTGVGIYATIDMSEARCLQSVYIYKLKEDSAAALEFYLAQLCSRAMLFFYYVLTNQVEWQSYPKLTHETLQQMPLIRPNLEIPEERKRHDHLVDLVQKRLKLGDRERYQGPSEEALAVDWQIEREVCSLFGLSTDQVKRITNRLRHAQNIRIIRELYPERRSGDLIVSDE